MNMWGRGMNIYKERKNSRTRYERDNDRYSAPIDHTKENNSDTIEYTNMSSYERYRREKLNVAKNDNKYNANVDNMRSYDDAYRTRYNYNDDMTSQRNDRYADYGRYDNNNMRNDERYMNSRYGERRYDDRDMYRDDRRYDRRDAYEFYDYQRPDDGYYDNRRDERDLRSPRVGKKKAGLTLKCKFMILVYFAIIAVITTLILINAVPNAKADSSYNEQPSIEISEEMLNKTRDGNAIDIVDYVYDTVNNTVKR